MALPGELFREVRAQGAFLEALLAGLDGVVARSDDGHTDHEFIGAAQETFREAIDRSARRLSAALAEMESLGVMDALEPAVWNVARVELLGEETE
jgi:hypothetical protein